MTGHSYGLSATRELVRELIRRQNSSEELDAVIFVCGEEGSGKSNLILNIIQIYEEETGQKVSITDVTRSLRELLLVLDKKHKSIVALDEGDELKTKNMWDKLVRRVEQAFVVARARANIGILAFVNPLKLNTYFRDDRSKGFYFCYKRKYALYFTRRKLNMLRERILRDKRGVSTIDDFYLNYMNMASFIEYNIPKYNGHLLDEYLMRKKENISRVLVDIRNELMSEEKKYTLNAFCKKYMLNRKTFMDALSDLGIEPVVSITNKYKYITEQQGELVLNHIKNKFRDYAPHKKMLESRGITVD